MKLHKVFMVRDIDLCKIEFNNTKKLLYIILKYQKSLLKKKNDCSRCRCSNKKKYLK